jgi:hypothetical protein
LHLLNVNLVNFSYNKQNEVSVVSSVLMPLAQLTTGQSVFAGVGGAIGVANICYTAYKAGQASSTQLRTTYAAMICLQVLALAFNAIAFSGLVSGNVALFGVGIALSVSCAFIINSLSHEAKKLEEQELQQEAGKGRRFVQWLEGDPNTHCNMYNDYGIKAHDQLIAIFNNTQYLKRKYPNRLSEASYQLHTKIENEYEKLKKIPIPDNSATDAEFQNFYREVVKVLDTNI